MNSHWILGGFVACIVVAVYCLILTVAFASSVSGPAMPIAEVIAPNVDQVADATLDGQSISELQSLLEQTERDRARLQAEHAGLFLRLDGQEPTVNGVVEADLRRSGLLDETRLAGKRIADLMQEIEDKRSVDPSALYGAATKGKTPQWIECKADGVVLHPRGLHIDMDALDRALDEALQNIDYIVFLIRPDGFDAFEKARKVAELRKISIGFEPVDAGWTLKYR